MRNHNHLLGSVAGVDGIKTGYIHDSGFNIVTSVHRDNRHIVAVVFGGRTAAARDARVRSLIDNNINIAAVKRTAPPVVEGWETAAARAKDDQAAIKVASAAPMPRRAAPAPGSTDPIKPIPVKTITVQAGAMHGASLSPLPSSQTASWRRRPRPHQGHHRHRETRSCRRRRPQSQACSALLPAKVASPATACRSPPSRSRLRPSRAAAG